MRSSDSKNLRDSYILNFRHIFKKIAACSRWLTIFDHFQVYVDGCRFDKYAHQSLPNFESLSLLSSRKFKDANSWGFLSSSKKNTRLKSETTTNSVQRPRKHRYNMMDPIKNKKNSCGPKPTIIKKKLKNNPLIIKLPLTQKSTDGVFNKPKMYSCISCAKGKFYRLAAYLRHVRKQHKEELLICELCEMDFTNPFVLQRHQRVRCRRIIKKS